MPDVRVHRVLASISRVAVLETLRAASEPLGVQDLAGRMGLHPNTVRKHLRLLTEHGFVTCLHEGAAGRGRPRFVYAAASETSPPQAQKRNYRLLAAILAEYLRETCEPGAGVEAGRRFGAGWVEADAGVPDVTLDRVVRMLDDIGFRPEVTADGSAVRLHHCPFHELARERQDVVCAVHLGLIRGALDQLGAPVEATRLVPFVTPRLCVVDIGPRPHRPSD